ncbi:unnamed protein product [Rhizophagus irregularis]|nr:unnamed protein product [Rhizophagus irregularis]
MSCSKIFSGDLTELTYEVIKYFQNDLSTLHSCILVNRLWCRLAIPLLWENPFSIHTGNYNFIEIYLHSLNDDFKINKYKIINKSSHSNILFNYPRFLKYLNTNEFIFSVDKWYKLVTSTTNSEDIVTDLKKLTDICVSLFKIFIENEVNLHTLEIEISSYQTCFSIIFDELILKNTNFIHNIRNLNLYYVYNYKENSVIKNRISQMINLQQNLKKILINFHGTERQNSYQIINLIENIKQNLNYLSFNIIYDIYDTEIRCTNSIILQILGQALPSKLEYLCLNIFQIKVNDFEVFLRNSMGTFIKKLLIYNSHGQRILPLIKTYIMKKKRVKYLAINESLRLSFSDNVKELISLEDEVNEFKLYNIEVQSYSGLLINSCDYVKEIN